MLVEEHQAKGSDLVDLDVKESNKRLIRAFDVAAPNKPIKE